MTAAGNIGEIFRIDFVFIVLHHPTGVSWELLGLLRRIFGHLYSILQRTIDERIMMGIFRLS